MADSSVLRQRTWTGAILCLFICLGFAFYLFSSSLSNGISPIDDHELVAHLQGAPRLPVLGVVALWQRDLQSTGRFRPVYNILRPLELFVWGSQLHLWYLARILVFGLSAWVCWMILERSLGILFASLISWWFFTFAFWADIIGRLGPSESYGLLGLLCWAIGVYLLYTNPRRFPVLSWVMLSIGSVIAILSKENMLIMLLPTLGVSILNRQHQNVRWISTLPVFSSLLAAFFVIRYLVRLSTQIGMDVYGNTVGFSRASLLLDVLGTNTVMFLILGFIIFLWFSIKAPALRWRRDFAHLTWAWATALALVISQFVFYNGQWPTNIRYDFPGMFFKLIVVVSLLFLVKRIILDRLELQTARTIVVILSIVLGFWILRRTQIGILRSRVEAYHHLTQSFSTGLQSLKTAETDTDIIVESTSINDLEIIHALQVHLRQEKISNSIYVRLQPQDSYDTSALGNQLYASLEQTHTKGTDVISPWSNRLVGKPCVSIFLGKQTQTECEPGNIVSVTW